jgi:ankyrin repeat domain-containing protein 50
VNTTCNGETALETASCGGHMKIVKMLLDAGASVNGEDGWALYSVSSGGYEEVVRILLEAGAAVNLKSYGETALIGALRCGHTKIVEMLVDAKSDVDTGALYYASSGGHQEIVRVLIEAGAAVNLKFLGETALDRASRCGHVKIVKMLLDAGADVKRGDGQVLHFGSSEGYAEVVRILVEAGADVTAKCSEETALETASSYSHVKDFNTLLDAGAVTMDPACMRNRADSDDYSGEEDKE